MADDLRSRIERALADTHDIERELGGGGMSRTYVALERALGRRVVIKVLAPELLAGISVERFRREVLLAAKLQHPHVVPVLSAGEVDDLPWFTMPYVEGDSLRKRLAEGPLELAEAISILRDVARALAYAHAQGIVHRDIKPDNVLLAEGSATVTDFGIAKAINAARTGGAGATLTQVGTSIGTPAYMSPEQAAGDDVDHRSDIYSFGAMAYEMLTGSPPFQATTPARVVAAHMTEPARDIRTVRADIPAPLADLVMACLAKDPAARPQEARDAVRALQTVTTTSGDGAAVPAVLRGGRVPLGKALTIWAAATAAVAVTAWAASDVIGLPDWVFPGSVGVMLAGLPAILVTAWVQRSAHRAFVATPQRTPGGTIAGTQGTMATLALKASPHVSWRRTWLGGGIAVGAFALLVLGFMVTRALGIGPAASLKGTGDFGNSETLVVADFRSESDSALGPTVSEALRTDLAQSTQLRVLTRAALREILRLMQRPDGSAVPFDLAREIATREGAKAVLDGNIVRLGQSYVVSARLVSSRDGAELATFRETAASEDQLITALGAMSRSIREKAGESLKSIRASSAMERVTTPSLPALRKYVEGSLTADEQGDIERGLALLEEAVELDTAFAMAWRKIAVLLGNERREQARANRAISIAFRHRDRLTDQERYLTEGYYYTRGPSPNHDRALEAYAEAMRLDSMSTSAINNSAVILQERNQYERAESLYRRVAELPRSFSGVFNNLVRTQVQLGRPRMVIDSVVAAGEARYPDNVNNWETRFTAAWGTGALAEAESLATDAARRARNPRMEWTGSSYAAAVMSTQGRVREGTRHAALATAASLRARNEPSTRLIAALDSMENVVWSGRAEQLRGPLERLVTSALVDSVPAAERPWDRVAFLASAAGSPAAAHAALDGFRNDGMKRSTDSLAELAMFEGTAAMADGQWETAVSKLRLAHERYMLPRRSGWSAMALAFDGAGRADSALFYYDKFLNTRSPDPWLDASFRARFLVRAGELNEGKGDTRNALRRYEEFLELWRNADAEFQPRVREIRERVSRLQRQVG